MERKIENKNKNLIDEIVENVGNMGETVVFENFNNSVIKMEQEKINIDDIVFDDEIDENDEKECKVSESDDLFFDDVFKFFK